MKKQNRPQKIIKVKRHFGQKAILRKSMDSKGYVLTHCRPCGGSSTEFTFKKSF